MGLPWPLFVCVVMYTGVRSQLGVTCVIALVEVECVHMHISYASKYHFTICAHTLANTHTHTHSHTHTHPRTHTHAHRPTGETSAGGYTGPADQLPSQCAHTYTRGGDRCSTLPPGVPGVASPPFTLHQSTRCVCCASLASAV